MPNKTLGSLSVAAGICLIAVTLIMSTGYDPRLGLWASLPEMRIITTERRVSEAVTSPTERWRVLIPARELQREESIPTQMLLAGGVIMIVVGVVLLKLDLPPIFPPQGPPKEKEF